MATGQNNKLDAQLHVTFYKHAELNSFQSRSVAEGGQGRKIFEEQVYIRILAPANRLNVIERRATVEDRQRFSRQFQHFVKTGEILQNGTPLDQLPSLGAAQVLELKALKVDTVEQLAGMADTTLQLLGTGGQDLKQRAIRFLANVQGTEKLSGEVQQLQRELADAMAKINALVQKPEDLKSTTVAVGQAAQAPK